MPESYLVLGGSGLIGRYIAKKLSDRGDVVAVLDLVQRYDDIPFHSGDICDEGAVISVRKKTGATCVFHTASPLATEGEATTFRKVNVEGTRNVISACVEAKVPKLVYTSSSGIIFAGHGINGADETHPLPEKGYQAYHETKIIAERMILQANGKNGLFTCALRPSGVFGPGDRVMIAAMWKQYQAGRTSIQIGNNKNRVDWTSVQNAADAHILAADYLLSPLHSDAPVAGEAFFITNDDPWMFWDFANGVWDRFDKHFPGKRVKKQPFVIPQWLSLILATIMEIQGWITGERPIMTRYVVLMSSVPRWHNISKAKTALGYVPEVSMEEELDNMVEWWMAQKELHNLA
ncbi:hypothetical protein C8R42DRAFT_656715 [Lentinula raphanica]|nr:hypothetical protein C8R42DRAFT_656715 [Lentinula raphanica]